MENESWLSENCEKDDKERREEVLNLTRLSTAHLGRKLSIILVSFIFLMSRKEEMGRIFEHIRTSLEPTLPGLAINTTCVVVDRIFVLLETGERGLRDRDKSKHYLRNKSHVDIEPFACETVDKFRDQIVFLENLATMGLRDTVSYEMMSDYIKHCDEELDMIYKDIRLVLDDPFMKLMEAKAKELWRDLQL